MKDKKRIGFLYGSPRINQDIISYRQLRKFNAPISFALQCCCYRILYEFSHQVTKLDLPKVLALPTLPLAIMQLCQFSNFLFTLSKNQHELQNCTGPQMCLTEEEHCSSQVQQHLKALKSPSCVLMPFSAYSLRVVMVDIFFCYWFTFFLQCEHFQGFLSRSLALYHRVAT